MDTPEPMPEPEITDYTFVVDEENVATIYFRQEEVHVTRAFRLHDQAVAKAIEWIEREMKIDRSGDVTLDVQNLAVDPDFFFGRKNYYG